MEKDEKKVVETVENPTEVNEETVVTPEQDENAIGFVSFAHMSDDVKSLSIEGVAPSTESIADGSYELKRPFLFLVKGEPSGDLKDFIDWINSTEADNVLKGEKIIKSK